MSQLESLQRRCDRAITCTCPDAQAQSPLWGKACCKHIYAVVTGYLGFPDLSTYQATLKAGKKSWAEQHRRPSPLANREEVKTSSRLCWECSNWTQGDDTFDKGLSYCEGIKEGRHGIEAACPEFVAV